MSLNDSVVLEFLDEHDMELPPKPLYRNLNRHGHKIGYSTVRLRVNKLEEHGLLSKDSDGYYELTDLGKRWLDGEAEMNEVE
ncbi:Ribonuclease R winged-helix domain-containing protein [Halogeometricum rufum]|uniref:Ribonuclease R winged-helix domain-containing protein n=1 Tax=Halogeometricum rufum TaxID=553469 RepID=A0A1I6G1Y0_9EURY|nr:winged-helix domain-containing protein [Halogeometricum rufum]SFR36172.1 Ribonuclease R winged-helix domain-containing protein [Halogeometricum rufum]